MRRNLPKITNLIEVENIKREINGTKTESTKMTIVELNSKNKNNRTLRTYCKRINNKIIE